METALKPVQDGRSRKRRLPRRRDFPFLFSAFLRILLFFLGLAVSLLPRRVELWLGPRLGCLALTLDRKRRKIAYENIRRCLPELGPEGWERLVRQNYEHYGILALELLHMLSPIPGHYRRYAERFSRVEGVEHWKRADHKGRGVLFVSAHLANWEMMTAGAAMSGVPLIIVTRHLKPEWLHKKIETSRLSTGVKAAYGPDTLPTILRALRKGESVGFVLDQYAPFPMGIPVKFFGVMVNTLAGIGLLAQRYGAAIVPVFTVRDPQGLLRIIFEPEMDLGADLKDSVKATQALVTLVEQRIRENPTQWLWVHRRFKNVKEALVLLHQESL